MTATNSVIVSWPAPSDGWILQDNPDVGNTNAWGNVGIAPITFGSEKQVIVSPPLGNRFFRLRQQ
jgi:hypothetical protein